MATKNSDTPECSTEGCPNLGVYSFGGGLWECENCGGDPEDDLMWQAQSAAGWATPVEADVHPPDGTLDPPAVRMKVVPLNAAASKQLLDMKARNLSR